MPPDAAAPPPDADRLAALERAVADLTRDVAALRAELHAEVHAGARAEPRAQAPTYASVFGAGPAPRAAAGAPTLLDRSAAYARRQAQGLGLPAAGAAGPDLEALVGRYATVAVAALLILMGVGAFLTWAVARVTVTPGVRVALGVVLAALLAGAGWWLRTRAPAAESSAEADAGAGSRRFGDLLLGIALAVTHVDAWAAGPYLGLVPPAAALGIAAAASAALAALAWRAGQQALFVVGVGGALVAPFVTNAGPGNPLVLAVYGWLVLATGMLALPSHAHDVAPGRDRPRRWRAAAAVLALGAAAYTGVQLDEATPVATVGNPAGLVLPAWTLRRDAPALFALACALTALAVGVARRRSTAAGAARTLGALAVSYVVCTFGALATLGLAGRGGALSLTAVAFAALLATHAALPLLGELPTHAAAPRVRWTPGAPLPTAAVALVLPLLLLAAALVTLDEAVGWAGATTAGVWAAVAAAAAWRATAGGAAARPATVHVAAAHTAAAGLASALVPVLALSGRDVARVALLAAHAALAAQLLPRVRHALTLLAPAVGVSVAAAWSAVLLQERPAYAYTPFLTAGSFAAGCTAAAAGAVAWRAWRDGRDAAAPGPAFRSGERATAVAAAAGLALLWGREELARAVSPDVSTFLLVGYFAAAGIAAIAVGRARAVRAARQVGLALALYAAFKALVQVSALDAVGLRVASYLLVGGFLLGVGYWYRAAGSRLGVGTPA